VSFSIRSVSSDTQEENRAPDEASQKIRSEPGSIENIVKTEKIEHDILTRSNHGQWYVLHSSQIPRKIC